MSSPARFELTGHAPFTITGQVARPLYPGTAEPLDLTFTNPNPTAIAVDPASVLVTIASPSAACPASPNFAVRQGLQQAVTIPANSTRSLSELVADRSKWPRVEMIETNTNQDACQGLTLTFTIAARAEG